MRRPRHLSAEERALWDHVARTVERRAPEPARPAPPPAVPVPAAKPPLPPLAPFRLGEKSDHHGTRNLIGGLAQDMGRPPVQMDARAFHAGNCGPKGGSTCTA
jgi:hypothetical protein